MALLKSLVPYCEFHTHITKQQTFLHSDHLELQELHVYGQTNQNKVAEAAGYQVRNTPSKCIRLTIACLFPVDLFINHSRDANTRWNKTDRIIMRKDLQDQVTWLVHERGQTKGPAQSVSVHCSIQY